LLANTAPGTVLLSERLSRSSKLRLEPSTSAPFPVRNQFAVKLAASGNASPLTERSLEVRGNSLRPPLWPPRPPLTVSAESQRTLRLNKQSETLMQIKIWLSEVTSWSEKRRRLAIQVARCYGAFTGFLRFSPQFPPLAQKWAAEACGVARSTFVNSDFW